MKKISVILVFSLIVVLLTSCMSNDAPSGAVSTEQTTETAENNEVVPEKSFISEKETLMSKICGLYGLDIVLFKKIQEGAFVYAGSVTELPDTISSEQVMLAKRLISYDPELFFVKDIELDANTNYLLLRAQYGGYYQTIRFDITLLNQGIIDSIKGFSANFQSAFGGW